jgi:hypothetical protein
MNSGRRAMPISIECDAAVLAREHCEGARNVGGDAVKLDGKIASRALRFQPVFSAKQASFFF